MEERENRSLSVTKKRKLGLFTDNEEASVLNGEHSSLPKASSWLEMVTLCWLVEILPQLGELLLSWPFYMSLIQPCPLSYSTVYILHWPEHLLSEHLFLLDFFHIIHQQTQPFPLLTQPGLGLHQSHVGYRFYIASPAVQCPQMDNSFRWQARRWTYILYPSFCQNLVKFIKISNLIKE